MTVLAKCPSDQSLTHDEVRELVAQAASDLSVCGKRVLIIIPDGTRTMPMPLMFEILQEEIGKQCFALVLKEKDISGIYFGPARDAWRMAAEHSAATNIHWVERPFQRVLAVLPQMYDDLWTGSKGMYKAEPASRRAAK